MSLAAGCPRCPTPVARSGSGGLWSCPEHGEVRPLWRPGTPAYDAFVEHLGLAAGFPTYLPWPLGPGWHVTDFAVVTDGSAAAATLVSVSGTSDLDGPVEAVVVTEEAGVGLGSRVAGTIGHDPGPTLGDGPAAARLRIGSQSVPVWPVSVAEGRPDAVRPGGSDGEWDRAVVVGEAEGRWLWLVLRPASALLMLLEDWNLRDATELGMALVELPFGQSHRSW